MSHEVPFCFSVTVLFFVLKKYQMIFFQSDFFMTNLNNLWLIILLFYVNVDALCVMSYGVSNFIFFALIKACSFNFLFRACVWWKKCQKIKFLLQIMNFIEDFISYTSHKDWVFIDSHHWLGGNNDDIKFN